MAYGSMNWDGQKGATMNKKTELEIVEDFAAQLSLNRVKTEGIYFDKDYRRQPDGRMKLIGEKAVIVTQGKTTKAAFGEGEKYKTYEEAVEGVKAHWRDYFKQRRQMDKSDTAKAGDRRRQKRYRDRKKSEIIDISRRQ